jgi:hypothetical protein
MLNVQFFKMRDKSHNLLFPHVQLMSGPSSLNIIAFLAGVHNILFLALIVNLIKLSAFGAFEFPIKKFDTFEFLRVQKDFPLHFCFKRVSKYLSSKSLLTA